jgi:hypothetical protein
MVKGLDLFRDHFREYADCYVLIGGTASHLALREEGLDFRATKDLDIILCIEALDERFLAAFWAFVRAGDYERQERATGARTYYRFQKPSDPAYPHMLELFSRQPDGINVPPGVHLTPIPSDSDLSSLSAILLDDTYYRWIMAGRRHTAGVPTVGPEHLIPLKARAHLDLRARRERNEPVKGSDIKKHRNDVVRLAQLLDPTPITDVPAVARADLRAFLAVLDLDAERLRNLRVAFPTQEAVTRLLETAYSLND